MVSVSRQHFLEAVHGDPLLQQALGRPDGMNLALRIARAAGFVLSEAEMLRSAAPPKPASQAEASSAERVVIDFDGDGVPDAVMEGGRWVMLDSDD